MRACRPCRPVRSTVAEEPALAVLHLADAPAVEGPGTLASLGPAFVGAGSVRTARDEAAGQGLEREAEAAADRAGAGRAAITPTPTPVSTPSPDRTDA